MSPPIERLDRRYTVDQVRYSDPLRMRMPRVDLDVNFETGSWQLTPEQVDRCVGTYRIDAGQTLACTRRDAALLVTPSGRPTDRLAAASATTFFSRRADVELAFELPADGGPATAVTVTQRGRSLRAVRE